MATRPNRPKQNKRTGKRAGKGTGKRVVKRRSRRWRWLWSIPLALVLFCGWQFWLFWQQTNAFSDLSYRQPSRLYGRPAVVQQGAQLSRDDLVGQLLAAGYTRHDRADGEFPDGDLPYGSFRSGQAFVELHRRIFPSPRGNVGDDLLRVTFAGGRVRAIRRGEQSPKGFWLDPPLIASFYGPELRERRPVQISELPPHLTWAVLAAEDANFEMHAGVSLSSIVRAAWVNLWANKVRQGGSTLTQQLVKNVYLTHERSWVRKAREALLSLLLELRYDKRTIFQAYLNEIYWGRSGNVNLMGVGAASWAYFGKHPAQLSLSESALLAGMIQSPTSMSPQTDSGLAAAKERRDFVLGRLAQLEWVELAELEAAAREELKPLRRPLLARGTPYFADAMKSEAERRFGITDLEESGYILHSTLKADDQRLAEQAVADGLAELETELAKGNTAPLQAALISIDPADGGIRSYVGGRDYGQSQFDRVSHARRQAGSSFKPVVYAAAFERHKANPATLLRDEPLRNAKWQPKNSDGKYRGYVTARTALEQSLNVPTARLVFDQGLDLDHVVEMAHSLGIRSKLKPFPALMLGAMEVTPLELATVYATLANGGVYNPTHGLAAAFAPSGAAIEGEPLPPPRRVVNAEVAFLVNQVLQGVIERGTGRSARQRGIHDRLAGKTGTTNSRRDSWFAGYAPQGATLVWVGYDNNSKTRLSGASAALPIWADFMKAVRPAGGYSGFAAPDGVVQRWIDPRTGGLAEASCSQRQSEYFLQGAVPGYSCADNDWRQRPRGREEHPLRGWLKRMRSGVGGPT